jgi:hypothetical protein
MPECGQNLEGKFAKFEYLNIERNPDQLIDK